MGAYAGHCAQGRLLCRSIVSSSHYLNPLRAISVCSNHSTFYTLIFERLDPSPRRSLHTTNMLHPHTTFRSHSSHCSASLYHILQIRPCLFLAPLPKLLRQSGPTLVLRLETFLDVGWDIAEAAPRNDEAAVVLSCDVRRERSE